MAVQLIRSTTYKGGKIKLHPKAVYKGQSDGKLKYHIPDTDIWFVVQQVPGGWVVHEMYGGCNC